MNDEQTIITRKKLEFFKQENTSIHISKNNGWFHNGKILEIRGDLIILDDEKSGATPIYFLEIKEVEKRREKKDGETRT